MTSYSYLPCLPLKAAKGLLRRIGSFQENAKSLSRNRMGDTTFGEFSKAPSLALSPVSFSELKSLGKMIHGNLLTRDLSNLV